MARFSRQMLKIKIQGLKIIKGIRWGFFASFWVDTEYLVTSLTCSDILGAAAGFWRLLTELQSLRSSVGILQFEQLFYFFTCET